MTPKRIAVLGSNRGGTRVAAHLSPTSGFRATTVDLRAPRAALLAAALQRKGIPATPVAGDAAEWARNACPPDTTAVVAVDDMVTMRDAARAAPGAAIIQAVGRGPTAPGEARPVIGLSVLSHPQRPKHTSDVSGLLDIIASLSAPASSSALRATGLDAMRLARSRDRTAARTARCLEDLDRFVDEPDPSAVLLDDLDYGLVVADGTDLVRAKHRRELAMDITGSRKRSAVAILGSSRLDIYLITRSRSGKLRLTLRVPFARLLPPQTSVLHTTRSQASRSFSTAATWTD